MASTNANVVKCKTENKFKVTELIIPYMCMYNDKYIL